MLSVSSSSSTVLCDDSLDERLDCPVGLSDRAELNAWLDSKETAPSDAEFDDMRAIAACQSLNLTAWNDAQLVSLAFLAHSASDDIICEAATSELVKRFRASAA